MSFLSGVFYFVFYSFIGWIAEVVYWFIQEGYLINRGFLIGPFCPMYGIGAIAAIIVIGRRDRSVGTVFLYGVLLAAVLEQTTSYILESVFNLKLWDYSYSRWNINGRLSWKNLFLFGIFGVVLLRYVHPLVSKLQKKIPRNILKKLAIIMIIYLSLDVAVTITTTKIMDSSESGETSSVVDIHGFIGARGKILDSIFSKE